jgi:steroid 5-alpha reductase family enzyme
MPDFAGGTNFVVLAIITLAFSGHHNARQIVCSLFIMVWGARLSAFLLFRILKTGKDDRFDDKRDKFFPFLGFWVFQMIWVWTVSLPVTVLNSPNVTQYPQPAFGTGRDIAGVVLYAIGMIMESVSDVQKYLFRARESDKSAICDKGFFSWTRHPNYFGEIIIQFGKPSGAYLKVLTDEFRNLHDCRLSSSKWLRAWSSLQNSLCYHSRSFLPHDPPHVCIRLDTPRKTWRKEAI